MLDTQPITILILVYTGQKVYLFDPDSFHFPDPVPLNLTSVLNWCHQTGSRVTSWWHDGRKVEGKRISDHPQYFLDSLLLLRSDLHLPEDRSGPRSGQSLGPGGPVRVAPTSFFRWGRVGPRSSTGSSFTTVGSSRTGSECRYSSYWKCNGTSSRSPLG